MAAAFRGTPLGQLTLDGAPQNLVLRFGAAAGHRSTQVKALPLPTATGVVPLSQVADSVPGGRSGPGVAASTATRSVTVSGTATGSNIGATTAELNHAAGRR